jgi:hypothetical protein
LLPIADNTTQHGFSDSKELLYFNLTTSWVILTPIRQIATFFIHHFLQ